VAVVQTITGSQHKVVADITDFGMIRLARLQVEILDLPIVARCEFTA
jgi:hypothetical protein